MKWTDEELHELLQMIDFQLARLFRSHTEYFKSLKDVKATKTIQPAVSKFIDSAVKNYDLLMTIRVKLMKDREGDE